MAVSPFRALAVVHVQGTWNRLRKQFSDAWLGLLLTILAIITLTTVLPVLAGLGLLGWYVGRELAAVDAGRAIGLAAAAFTGMTVIAGFVGGVTSGSRQLPWETLRAFPVGDRALFGAELFAGAGEAITLVELLGLLSACVGLCLGAPIGTPWFLVLGVAHALALLALQQLAGSVAQRLSRRLKAMLVFLPIVAVATSTLLPLLERRATHDDVATWLDRVGALTAWLPARQLLEATRGLVQGEPDVVALLAALAAQGAMVAVTGAAAFLFVSRERPVTLDTDTSQPARLWSFRRPASGIARLQWESLMQSLPGRFGLVIPLVTIILVRGPLAELVSGHGSTAQVSFGYAALAAANLLFNQFGLDRHGVKVLLLLPIEPMDLLRGKLWGFAAWHALQALLLLGLLVLTGRHPVPELASGLLVYACVFLLFVIVGQFASLWQPRPLRKNGMRASQPPLSVGLLIVGTMLGGGVMLFGLVFGARALAPSLEVPALALLAGALALVLVPAMRFNAHYLERSRERLVEVLGSAA